jgi:hypothetical protein
MKIRTLIVILFALILSTVIITAGKSDKYAGEEFIGTWINRDYNEKPGTPAKMILQPNGRYLGYEQIDAEAPRERGWYEVEDSWTDSQGRKVYQVKVSVGDFNFWFTGTVSDDGETFHQAWRTFLGRDTLPREPGPADGMYRDHRREM